MSKDRSEYFKEYKRKNKSIINEKQRLRRAARGQDFIDLIKKNSKDYRDRNKYTPHFRWIHLKNSSIRRNKQFNIPFDEYVKIIDKPCYYCNNEFKIHQETGGGLDRIDNKIGYQMDNVLPCCSRCNCIRGDFLTVEEAKVAILAVISYRNQGKS